MRKASNDYQIITNGGDEFLGIALGYDFTSEHEWGIKNTKRRFGIPDGSRKNMGVKSRTITKNIDKLIFKKSTYKKNKFAILYVAYEYSDTNIIPTDLDNYKEDILWRVKFEKNRTDDYKSRTPANLITAWSDGDFGIAVMGEKEVKWLEELHEAFDYKNVVIAMINHNATNPFAGTSLSLMIKDRLPKDIAEMMYSADEEHFDLQDYEKKTGIPKLKEKNRKLRIKLGDGSWNGNLYGHAHGYFVACSAKWISYDDIDYREKKKKEFNTKYDIYYHINYSDDENNFGAYTVEEIKEWLSGKERLTAVRKRLNPEKVKK